MSTVVTQYPYNGNQGSQQQNTLLPYGEVAAQQRMASKRRRLNPDEEFAPWEQQQQLYAANDSVSSFTSNNASSDYAPAPGLGSAASHGGSGDISSATAARGSSVSALTAPVTSWPDSAAPPYPDASSYSQQQQQPYFYHADPASFTSSSWPPTNVNSFVSQASNLSVPASSLTMPYFPPTATATAEGRYDTNGAVSSRNYQQELPLAQQYAMSQGDNDVRHQHQQLQRGDAPAPPAALYFEDASMHLKIQSLSILENLATQLIHTIGKASFPQIQEIMRGNDSEEGQAYTTLKNLFDQTRKVYSRETPFIDAIAIQMFQPSQQEVIRKANIATFISSILGAHDVSFFHLNEFFMETFVPLGHRLLKWQGAIYLELKTQTYISALINSDGSPEAMLDELFPSDLDAQILTRHPDAPSLSPSEQDFIDRSRARKSYLLAEDSTEEALRELPKKYQWHDFVREFASCISKNVDGIMNVPARSQPSFSSGANDRRATAATALQSLTASSQISGGRSNSGLPHVQSFLDSQAAQRDGSSDVGISKRSNNAASTIRQPWTKPEEDALLSGLERVNGPHWSQILALYGRGGSISEVLKDRNQVQLKDKARNLKLWYLKMGKDVPPALRGVTGELRKRGGARARAALGIADDDEDGDHVDGSGDVDGEDALERSQSSGKGGKGRNKRLR